MTGGYQRKVPLNCQIGLYIYTQNVEPPEQPSGVIRNDLQRRFLTQNITSTLLRHCFECLQCFNISTLCCAKNSKSRVIYCYRDKNYNSINTFLSIGMQEQVVHKKVAEILALEHLFSKLLDTFSSYLFFSLSKPCLLIRNRSMK